jgi:GLPGLI family protein
MTIKGFIFFIFTLAIFVSCNQPPREGRITSGRIDYDITYLNDNLDEKTMELLPKHMKLSFDENQALNNIEGFLGFYKLDAITDFHTRKCSTILKIFDKNYLFQGRRDEMMCCFDSMEDMKITETNEKKVIAGFECRKAVVFLPSSGKQFDIFYTDKIELKRPNSTNPYRKINGVLMEFELNLLYLKMRFTADKFQTLSVDPTKNALPKNIRDITRDQMTQLLNKLME